MTRTVWSDLHDKYRNQDWIDKPSIFAETAIEYFPHHGDLLELGAGLAQDSRFFAESGYNVIATDIEKSILEIDTAKMTLDVKDKLQFQQLDLREPFPIADNAFDIVYAHLSLHYFDKATTVSIFCEIERVLKPGGVFAFFTNSTSDPQYDTGKLIEADYFMIDDKAKRFFSIKTAREFARNFEIVLLDANGETYKDRAKGVHNLIRFVGKKKIS